MSAIAPGMILFAYLCGSISSAILVCRIAGLPQPRQSGSGNPGATNVLRIGGKGAAVAVLIFDVLKGMLPVWGAYALGVTLAWLGLIAIAACLGHVAGLFWLQRRERRRDRIRRDRAHRLGLNWRDGGHLAADRLTERLLVIGRDRQRADCAILRVVV